MRKLLVIAPLLLLAVVMACGGDDDDDTTSGSPTTDASASAGASGTPGATGSAGPTAVPGSATARPVDCTPNTEVAADADITWADILPDGDLPAPPGYSVADAEGDAPLLTVTTDAAVAGNVELLQFGLPDGFNPDQGFNALEAWAEGFYTGLRAEREVDGATLEGDVPHPAPFGEYCGVAYGYTVESEDGDVIERYAGYATYDPEKLYLFVAIYDEANEETSWTSPGVLENYGPGMAELAAALNFPPD